MISGDKMSSKKIGVVLNEGCGIDGPQLAIADLLARGFVFDEIIESNPKLKDDSYVLNRHIVSDVIDRLKQAVTEISEEGGFPVIIGGDHALSMGSCAAMKEKRRAVLWIDAHGDSNTPESSLTKRSHGMPVAALMGYGDDAFLDVIEAPYFKAEQFLLFGIRSLDQQEEAFIEEHKIPMISMEEIFKHSEDEIIEIVLAKLEPFTSVHISFDLDSIDPVYSPGVSTPVAKGLHPSVPLKLIERLFKEEKVSSMDIVEYNPLHDNGNTLVILEETLRIVRRYKGVSEDE